MLKRIAKWLAGGAPAKPQAFEKHARPQATGVAVEEYTRFDSADTDRLNASHWVKATGQSLNTALNSKLKTLQARCAYEYSANPLFEGVVNTFAADITGRDGPGLQVESDNEQFNDIVEEAWAEVWANPEPRMRHGGPEIMQGWIKTMMLAGSYLNIYADVERPGGLTTFGFQSVHTRRLVTPPKHAGDLMVAFGIRQDEATGRPTTYYVDATQGRSYTEVQGVIYDTFTADQVNHVFIPVEPEQITGYPLMTSTLGTAADLRGLSKTVMESMKLTAALTPGLEAKHPELVTGVDPLAAGCMDVEPGQANIAPAGYGWASLASTQPNAQYQEFYNSKAAELGRPIHMPLMVVLLSVGDANFSSAQFEGEVYTDGVANFQGVVERRTLTPMLERVIAELELRGRTARPDNYKAVWTWNVPPNANFEKQVAAIINLVKAGIIAPSQGGAMLGFDWDSVVAARQKCEEDLEAAGLPPTETGGASQALAQEQAENQQEVAMAAAKNNANNNGTSKSSRFADALGL